jgi:ankyrin repeat protein
MRSKRKLTFFNETSTAELALISAADMGDLKEVERILKNDGQIININSHNNEHDQQTALHLACGNDHLDIVKCLIETGNADVNALGLGRCPPLYAAAFFGHIRVIKYLLQKGADPDLENESGETPRECAATEWDIDIAEFMPDISNGPSVR